MIRPVPPAPTFRGFTLVEMAVVLMIVALLIGGMVLPLSAQQDLRARQDTERTLAEVREALYGFAVLNSRLPRPATSSSNGNEAGADCATDAACAGFIPWSTLGVPRSDAWGKLIRYSVTPAFANSTGISLTSVPNRSVSSRDNAGAVISLANTVPAVVFSQGKQRWGTLADNPATELDDGSSSTNIDEDSNRNGPTAYVSRIATDSTAAGGGEFDDLLLWLPANILVARLASAGKL